MHWEVAFNLIALQQKPDKRRNIFHQFSYLSNVHLYAMQMINSPSDENELI